MDFINIHMDDMKMDERPPFQPEDEDIRPLVDNPGGYGGLEEALMDNRGGITAPGESPGLDPWGDIADSERQEIRDAMEGIRRAPDDPYLTLAPPYEELVVRREIEDAFDRVRNEDLYGDLRMLNRSGITGVWLE